jgi:hypothetical protein
MATKMANFAASAMRSTDDLTHSVKYFLRGQLPPPELPGHVVLNEVKVIQT